MPTGRGRLAEGPPRIITAVGGVRLFDNIAVAEDGSIVVACIISGELVTIGPDGHERAALAMPGNAPTALAFGGPARRQLFVTLSGAGGIARIAWPHAGIPPLPGS